MRSYKKNQRCVLLALWALGVQFGSSSRLWGCEMFLVFGETMGGGCLKLWAPRQGFGEKLIYDSHSHGPLCQEPNSGGPAMDCQNSSPFMGTWPPVVYNGHLK